jgi:hypothetical protein
LFYLGQSYTRLARLSRWLCGQIDKDLGPVLALRFLNLLHREPKDYVDVSRRLYAGQSFDEIFERAEKQ